MGNVFKTIPIACIGSGTTIIACEQLDRTAIGMEIDPGYCDVIIDRWERFSNGKARKA